MAVLAISEHTSAVSVIGTTAPAVLPAPALVIQQLAVGGASVPSAAFGSLTKAVMLVSDIDCHYLFGPANGGVPVAVAATSMYLPAKVPVIFGVSPGQQVAVIA